MLSVKDNKSSSRELTDSDKGHQLYSGPGHFSIPAHCQDR